MASIGEVSATLKADIGQYVGPMQQAAQATAQIQTSVENASKALIAEGAAGTAAGKGLADAGTGVQSLAQQLAAVEGRVTQLQTGFAALGIQAQGREFARATAEVSRLKAELAAVGGAVPDLGPKLEVPLKRVAPATQSAALSVNHLRGALANLASSAAGIPGPLGNIGSRLLQFGAGGPVTVAVLAGLAAISLAWTKWRENVERETARAAAIWERTQSRMRGRDAFIGLVEEREEAVKRLRDANKEIARLQAIQTRPGGTIAGGRDDLAQALAAARLEADAANRALQALDATIQSVARDRQAATDALALARVTDENQRAILDYQQAVRALAAINAEVAASQTTTVEQIQAQAAATDRVRTTTETLNRLERERVAGLRETGRTLSANVDLFGGGFLEASLERLQKQLMLQRQLKEELAATAATQQAMRDAETEKQVTTFKADTSIKDSVRAAQEDAMNATRDVAQAMSRAFMDAFSDEEKSITDRITSVLRAALRAAIEKLIVEKIFASFLNFITGGGSKGAEVALASSSIAAAPAPTLTMPAMESAGSVPIVVPLNNLPPARSPVEMARDQLHQAVWVETARVALQNGVNLQPRFR